MTNIVSKQPLTNYPQLQQMINVRPLFALSGQPTPSDAHALPSQDSETLFKEISGMCSQSQDAKCHLVSEERLFIEAILDLKTQANS